MVKENSKLKKNKYIIIILASTIIGAILLISLIGRPLYSNLRAVGRELKEKKIVLEKEQDNLNTLRNLESQKEELIRKNEKVLAALPTDKDVSRLFVQYEAIAAKSGAKIDSVSEVSASEGSSRNELIYPVSYNVSLTAPNYNSFIESLKRMEDAVRILSVSSLNISSSENSITASFVVDTFMRGGQN
ncbi:MAG: type 4a pilus biogenesis protein PilO [Patescibacteria group bacterium]|nr:type 4a pilus biogenesis protein PilO [Patescibacteria group bacterium]